MTYVIFDTETTGLHPDLGDRIIEIAAIRVKYGKITDEIFDSLINPLRLIPKETEQIHGITNELLQKAPEAKEAIPKFLQFVGSDTLVAHNAPFDISFLQCEMQRLGLDYKKIPQWICTQVLVQQEIPSLKSKSLDAVMEYLNIHTDRRHRALDDVKATAQVFLKIYREREEQTLF